MQLPGALHCGQERRRAHDRPHQGAQLAVQQGTLRGRNVHRHSRTCVKIRTLDAKVGRSIVQVF